MSGTIASTASTTHAATTASAAQTTFGNDTKTFLTMLTTQLQNQDPTAPVDATQFTQQLVQLSQVEQQIQSNASLQQLVALQQVSQVTSAASLVGKSVEVESDHLTLQNGSATLRLPAAGTATTAQVSITDQAGRVVRRETIALGAQPVTWQWDGRDSNGNSLANGSYAVAVSGAGATGSATPVSFTVIGTATGAERVNGVAQLDLGGLTVPFDKVHGLAATN